MQNHLEFGSSDAQTLISPVIFEHIVQRRLLGAKKFNFYVASSVSTTYGDK